jgi:hypothetical protein
MADHQRHLALALALALARSVRLVLATPRRPARVVLPYCAGVSGFRLGVDYGTSHTVAVLEWPDGRRRPLHFDASGLLPSAVYAADDGSLATGVDALRAGRNDPARLEPNPKRRVDDGEVLLGAKAVPVTTLAAATFQTVLSEALRVAGEPLSEVTVTYPAGWGSPRREVLSRAVRQAGFASVLLVPEPVAAATYFVSQADAHIPVGRCAVVYDLGAGTFDASVVRRTRTGFEVLATGGLDDVGGLDLDAVVIERIGTAMSVSEPASWDRLTSPDSASDLRARHLLWTEARQAKESLSRQPTALVHVPLVDRGVHVGREEFEQAAAGLLGQTAAAMMRTVADAGVGWAEVAAVFLVGGSSRVPLAATVVHRACGIAPTTLEQPELVVAEGSLLTPATQAPSGGSQRTDPAPASPAGIMRPVDDAKQAAQSIPERDRKAEVLAVTGPAEPEFDGPLEDDKKPKRTVLQGFTWATGRSAGGWRWQRPALIAAALALLVLLPPLIFDDGGTLGAQPTGDAGAPVAVGTGGSTVSGPSADAGPGTATPQVSALTSTPARLQQAPTTARAQKKPIQQAPTTNPAQNNPSAPQTTSAVLEVQKTRFTGYCGPGFFIDISYTVRIRTSPGNTAAHYIVDFDNGETMSGDARTDQSGAVSRTDSYHYYNASTSRDTTYNVRFQTTTPSQKFSNTVQIVIDCANF